MSEPTAADLDQIEARASAAASLRGQYDPDARLVAMVRIIAGSDVPALLAAVRAAGSDLDLACELLDDARHVIYDNRGGLVRVRTKEVLFSDAAGRLIREWEQRKRAAADPTPASVLIHQHNLGRA